MEIGMSCTIGVTQDFTMEEVHVVESMAVGLGQVPSGAQGQSPGRGPLATKSQKLKKCEISLQLLTFSCSKFRI